MSFKEANTPLGFHDTNNLTTLYQTCRGIQACLYSPTETTVNRLRMNTICEYRLTKLGRNVRHIENPDQRA